MVEAQFQTRQCESCRFRFSVMVGNTEGEMCPNCGSPTRPVGEPFGNQKARGQDGAVVPATMVALLDNVRSGYNVGSIFRTADGVGIEHLHLCGITPTPAHSKVAKTALGAEQAVPWTYHNNALDAAVKLKSEGYRLWTLEQGRRAQSLFEASIDGEGSAIVLVVGNELSGVDPDIVSESDQVIYIPMEGLKGSLNVVVAFGVAAYFVRFGPK